MLVAPRAGNPEKGWDMVKNRGAPDARHSCRFAHALTSPEEIVPAL
jgi:hypothetical protein